MRINFIDETGVHHTFDGVAGDTVMRCATEHAVAGIIGECGGAMACASRRRLRSARCCPAASA